MSDSFATPGTAVSPDFSVHVIFRGRILEWVAISFSSGSSRPRDQTHVSCLAGGFFTTEPPGKPRSINLLFSCSVLSDSLQPHGLQQARLPVLHYLPEFAKTHVHWVSDTIQAFHPLSPPSPPAFNLSSINIFFNKSALRIKWLKRSSFNFSISPSNEYSGLISFRIDWSNLLVVRGTLKSLLQHHSLKISILWRSALFIVQLSHPYIQTWLLEKPQIWLYGSLSAKSFSAF